MFITQDGNPVKWFYTKDTPNGLPELKQVKVKGKLTWDDSDTMEFLEKMVKTEIAPRLSKSGVAVSASNEPQYVDAEEVNEDELPF